MKRVLIYDEAQGLAARLAEWLSPLPDCELLAAYTMIGVQEHLEKQPVDLLLADVHGYLSGIVMLPAWKAHQVRFKAQVAWLVQYDIQDYLRLALTHRIYHLFPKQLPLHRLELQTLVTSLLDPITVFQPQRYFPDTHRGEQFIIQNSTDILEGFHRMRDFLTRCGARNVDDIGTGYLEAATNAVYHACKNEYGDDRYVKGQFIEALQPDEWVNVSVWVDAEKAGVCIRDQGGSVTLEDTIYWTERQVQGSGLLDIHGRGFFLLRVLTDRFIMAVERGKQTQALFWNYHQPSPHANRPLLLYDIAHQPEPCLI